MTEPGAPEEDRPRELLAARGLRQSYGDLEVLEGLSISVFEGELAAVVGANGSGKTTLLRVLASLLSPDDGTVETEDDVAGRRIGYLPQRPSFRRGFTAEESLQFYLELLPEFDPGTGYVENVLRDVGLWTARDRSVTGLSGGMRRLLGIAQARIGDPPVMLLDEPTSGLDPEMTRDTFEILGRMAGEGTSTFITTHDLEAVERHANRVSFLVEGEVAVSGTPDDVVARHDVDSLSDVFDLLVADGATSVDAGGRQR